MSINIAIDGPSGAGKSTLAKRLAQKLGFVYVDTGAIYRCVGLYALKNGIDTADENAVVSQLKRIRIKLNYKNGVQHMILNDTDVTEKIRTPEVSAAASAVSAYGAVRDFLLDMQRKLAKENDCIMDGRDIGTVVLPDANVKFFVTAKPEVRAQRRFDELKAAGQDVTYEQVFAAMKERDDNDKNREIAPLKPADTAIILNTTKYTVEECVDILDMLYHKKISEA